MFFFFSVCTRILYYTIERIAQFPSFVLLIGLFQGRGVMGRGFPSCIRRSLVFVWFRFVKTSVDPFGAHFNGYKKPPYNGYNGPLILAIRDPLIMAIRDPLIMVIRDPIIMGIMDTL